MSKLKIFFLITLLLGINSTFSYSTAIASPLSIAVGSANSFNPLLGQSIDEGHTWYYPNFPDQDAYGWFNSAACYDENSCIAVGWSGVFPLLILSDDSGTTWNQPNGIRVLPTEAVAGDFSSVACKNKVCIAVGTYATDEEWFPLLAQSTDEGKTWAYSSLIKLNVPAPYSMIQLTGVSCNKNFCVTVGSGFFETIYGKQSHPLLAVSKDSGVNWSYKNAINDLNNFPSTQSITGGKICCSDSICVAIFSGHSTSNSNNNIPLLAQSNDQAVTWSYPKAINETAVLPKNFVSGSFYSMSCSQDHCVAVGYYKDNKDGFSYPLIAETKDAGKTWNYPKASYNKQLLPANFVEGTLHDISCNKHACIAVGSYSDDPELIRHFPLIAVNGNGKDWQYLSADEQQLPIEVNYAYLASITCNNNICIAAGGFQNNFVELPLSAVSHDNGKTWTYPTSPYDPTVLPNSFQNGSFRDIARK